MMWSMDAIDGASSLRIIGFILSGPAALWGFRFPSSFSMSCLLIWMSCMIGCGSPACGLMF